MNFSEVYNNLPEGWLSKNEAKFLHTIYSVRKGPVLEVGCWAGRSTVLLASLGRPLICVDPFEFYQETDQYKYFEGEEGDLYCEKFRRLLIDRNLTNVTFHRCCIEDWRIEPIESAYLDGNHTYTGTLAQIDVALRAGAEEICLHDYGTNGGGLQVKRAVDIRQHKLQVVRVIERIAYCQVKR